MNINDARELALAEMLKHGLDDWTFRFDKAKTRAGMCSYNLKIISLSHPITILWDEADVLDIIRHEIAHAITGYSREERHHGEAWKRNCVLVGAKPRRCYDSQNMPAVAAPWNGVCAAGCGLTYTAHRRPKQATACNGHGRSFNIQYLIIWTDKDGLTPGIEWATSISSATVRAA
jgi:predicted SprT family Zn-dependent metalloprotease